MKSPCKGCEYRVLGCHSTCAAYIKYSTNRKKEIEIRDIRGDVFGYVKDSNNRIKRCIRFKKSYQKKADAPRC